MVVATSSKRAGILPPTVLLYARTADEVVLPVEIQERDFVVHFSQHASGHSSSVRCGRAPDKRVQIQKIENNEKNRFESCIFEPNTCKF